MNNKRIIRRSEVNLFVFRIKSRLQQEFKHTWGVCWESYTMRIAFVAVLGCLCLGLALATPTGKDYVSQKKIKICKLWWWLLIQWGVEKRILQPTNSSCSDNWTSFVCSGTSMSRVISKILWRLPRNGRLRATLTHTRWVFFNSVLCIIINHYFI